jgi:hypothetical protein
MNKIGIGLALAIGLLVGCSKSPQNENGTFVGCKTDENTWSVSLFSGGGSWDFNYIEVDGHEYLVMHGVHRSGLTHSPKCPCYAKEKSNIK